MHPKYSKGSCIRYFELTWMFFPQCIKKIFIFLLVCYYIQTAPLLGFRIITNRYLTSQNEKFAFGLPELEYLGHFVFTDGLKAELAKYKAILEWPQPTNLGELQSFHSIANCYFKFMNFLPR